jgi:hypothetical protein
MVTLIFHLIEIPIFSFSNAIFPHHINLLFLDFRLVILFKTIAIIRELIPFYFFNLFIFKFLLFYYSYVPTMLGSFLSPAPTH